MSESPAARYAPKDVEGKWYAVWESEGCFKPEARPNDAPAHVIVIPPPNVTGSLHMGHGLNNTLQDVVTRYRRMRGDAALYLPGTDHAGIATQNVVEKELAKEKKTRDDLGREAFIARTWEWKEKYGGRIIEQLKKLGCSCDWSRERFTMDEGLSKAVTHAFVELHKEGLIYQGERLINWCPRCRTALSDEEAEAVDEKGGFYRLRYPVDDASGRYVVVATTRPETMFGDTAVAVHPDDPRYKDLVGKFVRLPLTDRRVPIVADTHADPEKGTGAVKITPAHDFNDFAVGERHGLPRVRAMDDGARMTEAAGEFSGLDRFEARKRVAAKLEELGLLDGVEDKEIPLPRCYRCATAVEPHLSKQWFVKMRPLLEPAAAAVKDGRVKIVPERHARTYLDWVEQFRDWCVSRQIWWGHRIPAYVSNDGETVVSATPPESKDGRTWTQDPDVLDTWFSSQLWPFSTLGWPDRTPDLKRFYPTRLLVTARDIIYFWVARMVMCGLKFLDEVPFTTVYITGTVLDAQGRRMSKSLGNGIDPVAMIDKYGCDAVRFTLVQITTEGQDLKLAESRFEGGRNFVNKVWNACRFVQMSTGDFDGIDVETGAAPYAAAFAVEDRWIRSRCDATVAAATAALDDLKFDDVARLVYEFVWNDFCDWYLEITKARIQDATPEGAASRRAAQAVLIETVDRILRLLHPIAPFVTEEIREQLLPKLRGATKRLILEAWPKADPSRNDPKAEREIEALIALVRTARTARDEYRLERKASLRFVVRTSDAAREEAMRGAAKAASALANLSSIDVGADAEKPPESSTKLAFGCEIFVPLAGLVDLSAEKARLTKQLEEAEAFAAGKRRKLADQGFTSRAKPEIVDKERATLQELDEKIARLRASLVDLG
jgi:valyl-tRNA synthetase